MTWREFLSWAFRPATMHSRARRDMAYQWGWDAANHPGPNPVDRIISALETLEDRLHPAFYEGYVDSLAGAERLGARTEADVTRRLDMLTSAVYYHHKN